MVLAPTSAGYGQPQEFQNLWHVDASATGDNDGSGWENAFTDLQSALAAATSTFDQSDQIWVAAGTYYPAGEGNQSVSFDLRNQTSLYGGFLGNAPGGGETLRSKRNPAANETILSGDIDLDGDLSGSVDPGNSLHVVKADGVNYTAVLNGFTIRDGYAGGGGMDENGAGILIRDASPVIVHCKLIDNTAEASGGGIFVDVTGTAAPVVFNSSFTGNFAVYGSGMRLEGEQETILVANCLFYGQLKPGGAIDTYGPDLDVTNAERLSVVA